MFRKREVKPIGVPMTTDPDHASNKAAMSGGSFDEHVIAVRNPQTALTISAVYRATELRAKTEAQFEMQYQRLNKEGGNFIPDMWGYGRNINYLLQVQPNPLMSASSFFEGLTIHRLMLGNGIAYIERDAFGGPSAFWLCQSASYDCVAGKYNLTYQGENGPTPKEGVSRKDVIHIANTFRTADGLWGIPTIRYALDTLSLIKTVSSQALENAAKGGRVKLLIGEDVNKTYTPITAGMFDPGQMKSYAKEINSEIYQQDVVSMRGLDKVQQISMSAQEMQMVEMLGMGVDDVARYWGTPRPLLMADTNSHYTTYQNATMEYLTRTVQPDIIEMEQEFQRKVLEPEDFSKRRIHLCEQPLLRLDKESQAKVDEINLRTGVKTVNELRQQYDLPSVPNGDRNYISTNLAELGSEKLNGGSTDGGRHGMAAEETGQINKGGAGQNGEGGVGQNGDGEAGQGGDEKGGRK